MGSEKRQRLEARQGGGIFLEKRKAVRTASLDGMNPVINIRGSLRGQIASGSWKEGKVNAHRDRSYSPPNIRGKK